MPLHTGTLSLEDLLANRFISPYAFGIPTIQQVLQRDRDVHNNLIRQAISVLAEPSSDRQRISGSSINGAMTRVDEVGRAPTQKLLPGASVGFPMDKYQYSIGWDSEFMRQATVSDMAVQQLGAEKAHYRQVMAELKRAIYTPTDRTYYEMWTSPANNTFPLTVKAFLNADGDPVPEGPNGEVFATSHTHYVGAAVAANADVLAIINTVVEHGYGEGLILYINAADETFIRGLAGFIGFIDSRLTLNVNATLPTERLDYTVANNRAIGYFGAATVWVKPWALQGYFFAAATGTANKPLVLRERDTDVLNGLRVVAQNDEYPLHAQFMEVVFGFGVWNRANGAVLYNGNAVYQAPTITDP